MVERLQRRRTYFARALTTNDRSIDRSADRPIEERSWKSMILWTRRRAKTLHRQWKLIEDASVLPLPFINRPSVLQRRAGVVKRTGSIEFRDSTGVSSLALLFFLPRESLGDSVTLNRMHSRYPFCSSCFSRADSKDDRDRRVRSPTIHQTADKFYRIMYLPWDAAGICEILAFKGNQQYRRLWDVTGFHYKKAFIRRCITKHVAITFFSDPCSFEIIEITWCIRLQKKTTSNIR